MGIGRVIRRWERCLRKMGGPKTNFAFFAILPRALVVATACVPLKIVPMPGILHKWKQGTAFNVSMPAYFNLQGSFRKAPHSPSRHIILHRGNDPEILLVNESNSAMIEYARATFSTVAPMMSFLEQEWILENA